MALLKAASPYGERRRSSAQGTAGQGGWILADGASPPMGYAILLTVLVRMVSLASDMENAAMCPY